MGGFWYDGLDIIFCPAFNVHLVVSTPISPSHSLSSIGSSDSLDLEKLIQTAIHQKRIEDVTPLLASIDYADMAQSVKVIESALLTCAMFRRPQYTKIIIEYLSHISNDSYILFPTETFLQPMHDAVITGQLNMLRNLDGMTPTQLRLSTKQRSFTPIVLKEGSILRGLDRWNQEPDPHFVLLAIQHAQYHILEWLLESIYPYIFKNGDSMRELVGFAERQGQTDIASYLTSMIRH